MSDAAHAPSLAPSTLKSTKKSNKSKSSEMSEKPRVKPSHPKTSDMVTSAVKNLKERGGSSLQAIKKYISSNYKVDAEKVAPFIRKYLKNAVASGALIRTKGKGASGSFKLALIEKAGKKAPAKPVVPKPKTTKSNAKSVTVKKTAVKSKKTTAPTKTSQPSLAKVKKSAKPPTKKSKTPKPKSVGSSRSVKKLTTKK